MKASHELLIKASELGILRSLPEFLAVPLQIGRLRRRFEEVGMMVDVELRKIFKQDPDFFSDNKEECGVYLEKFGMIMGTDAEKKVDIHVASLVAFCLIFLEESKSKYPDKLYTYLQDILNYYERNDNVKYSDFQKGVSFSDEWELLKGN